RYAHSAGASIAYQVVGEGPLDVLFLTGWITQVEQLWEAPANRRFLERLTKFGRLIIFDSRGTGLSDRVLETYTLEQEVRDALARIRAPALVMHRPNEHVWDVRHSRYLAEHIPGARYVQLEGEDSFPFVGDSAAITEEIEEFLTGARAGEVTRALRTVLF